MSIYSADRNYMEAQATTSSTELILAFIRDLRRLEMAKGYASPLTEAKTQPVGSMHRSLNRSKCWGAWEATTFR